MYVQSERTPNARELAMLEQFAARWAPPPEPSAPEPDSHGWLTALPWRWRRERAQRGRRRVEAMRHDRAAAWMHAPRVRVWHFEAARVALVRRRSGAVLIFDIGDGRLFALDDEWFPHDNGPWPNSVFEFWTAANPPNGGFRTAQLFCYGEALQATEYSPEEVEEYLRRTNTSFLVGDTKEGVFPGQLEDVLGAYARYDATNPPARDWLS